MAQNEVKATASLDTKEFERGLKDMDRGIKDVGRNSAMSLGTLAGAFLTADIAAQAIRATINRIQQVVRDSTKAYDDYAKSLKTNDEKAKTYIATMNQMNDAIAENNRLIGESMSGVTSWSKSVETGLSTLTSYLAGESTKPYGIVRVLYLLASLRSGGGISAIATDAISNTAAGVASRSRGLPNNNDYGRQGYRGATERDVAQYEQDKMLADMGKNAKKTAEALAAWGASLDRISGNVRRDRSSPMSKYPKPLPQAGAPDYFDPGYIYNYFNQPETPGKPLAQYSEGTPGPFSTFEDYQKYVERMEKINAITQQFGQNLVSTLFDTFSRGQNVMKAIGNVIVDTLKSALAEIAGQAIGKGITSIFTSAMTVGVSAGVRQGVAVEPARQRMAARSIMPGLAYETRRGRGF